MPSEISFIVNASLSLTCLTLFILLDGRSKVEITAEGLSSFLYLTFSSGLGRKK